MITTPSDILSQEEIDKLLSGLSTTVDEPEIIGGIKSYDIGRQERIVRGRMPALEILQEKFNRNLRTAFFTFFKKSAEIMTENIKIQKYQNFIRSVVVPSNFNVIQIKPFRGQSLLVFEPNLIFLMIDYLYGGTGTLHSRVEGREFSQVETQCIKNIVNITLTELKKTWIGFYDIEPLYIRSEMNSQFANVASVNEIVITISLIIDFGNSSGKVFFCIPYSSIETIKDLLYNTMTADQMEIDHRWHDLLKTQILETYVNIHADIAKAQLSIGELTELKVDDVISLQLIEQPTLFVNRLPIYTGKIGVSNNKYGFKLIDKWRDF
jgi:flagellar motor switch protein FliM